MKDVNRDGSDLQSADLPTRVPCQRVEENASAMMESLEDRTHFAVGPQVTTIIADNRGQVTLTFNQAINPATLNGNTVRILTAGADGVLNTTDDVVVPSSLQYTGNTLYITANTPANKLYRIELLTGANGVVGKNKRPLYGNSGPGGKGGNFEEETISPNFIVRFNTIEGAMNVALSANTPITNQNFVNYVNAGSYDASFFHRSEPSQVSSSLFVLQGGGFRVDNSSDTINQIPTNSPIPLEPTTNKNLRGTIAMARTSDTNAGTTSEFFFNTESNPSLDSSATTDGYTPFGAIIDSASFVTLNKLANPARVINLNGTNSGSFGEVPVLNYIGGAVDPVKNLEIVFRAAFLMNVLPTIQGGTISPAASRATTDAPAPVVFSKIPLPPQGLAAGGSVFTSEQDKKITG